MAKYLIEPPRRIDVAKKYDVVILGGGIAGCAAAIAARKLGVTTCVIEKQGAVGGLATLGNVNGYLPLCDGQGRQIAGGLAEKLLKLSISDGYAEVPKCWQKKQYSAERIKERYWAPFNTTYYLMVLEQALLKYGVDIWYDTRACETIMGKGKIKALVVENKSGRLAIEAKVFIDASGDADLCTWAGESTVSLNGNVRCGWTYYDYGKGVKLTHVSKPYESAGEAPKKSTMHYRGDSGQDVSQLIINSRKLIMKRLKQLQKEKTERVDLVNVPTIATTRMTRRLVGAYEIAEEDDHRYFEDTVGMTGYWLKAGPIFCIPYKSLIGVKTNNLITAGRCISTKGWVWDVTRAIPTCAVTGEAAGTAAAMAVKAGTNLKKLSVENLRKQLKKQKVILDKKLTV